MMIPPEIIDHVLGFLQWDRITLKFCAQAHPTLSKLVERHIYVHLTVHNFASSHPGTYHSSDLFRLISQNPEISKSVRSFRMDLLIPSFFQPFYTDDNYEELALILPLLTQLEAVFLSASGAGGSCGWYDLRESFRIAFINCLQLPSLTDVKLSFLKNFPLSILDLSRSLKRLSLSGTFDYSSGSSQVYPSLDSLLLNGCLSMDAIISWLRSRSLLSLEYESDFRPLSRLLEVSADSLTTLKIHVPHEFRTRYYHLGSNFSSDFTPIPLSLARLPHLTQLVIRSSISFTRQCWVNSPSDDSHELRLSHTCLPAVMQLLHTLTSPPTKLVLLLIEIDIELNYSFDDVSEVNWSPLLSFPYFDIIPNVELRVRAKKNRKHIPSVELLNTLKQDPYLMQLEGRRSFLVKTVEEHSDNDRFSFP